MTLRGSLRSTGGAPISLFAFQDIIFAATGVFLLISILMTLFGKVDMLATEAMNESSQLREELELLSERQAIADRKLRVLENEITISPSQYTEDIDDIVQNDLPNIWFYDIDSVLDFNRSLRQKTDQDYQNLSNQVMVMNRKEHRLELLLSGGYQAIDQAGQAIIREGTAHDFREPIFLTLGQSGFIISYIGRPDLNQELDTQQALKSHIQESFSPSTQNFLIYLKPSGIKHFDSLKKMLRTMNYQIGYEPVTEDFKTK